MKMKKTLYSILFVGALAAVPAMAQASSFNKEEISNGMEEFSNALLKTVPEAATQQNVWADAYIGKLFPSLTPHLGFGVSVGGTLLDMKGFKHAAAALTNGSETDWTTLIGGGSSSTTAPVNFTIPDTFILPSATVDVRLGGVMLPFDIGLCAVTTNPALITTLDLTDPSSVYGMSQAITFDAFGFNGSADYLALGIDFRYRLYEGDVLLPVISVGGGYYYTKGNFKVSSESQNDYTVGTATYTVDTEANMALAYSTEVFFAQIQASKNIGIGTLFGGLRGIVSKTNTEWAWNYSAKEHNSGTALSSDGDSGTGNSDTATGVYNQEDGTWNFSSVQPQIYLGYGFNLACFQTTLSLCADIRSFVDVSYQNYQQYIWSGALSFHVKF